MSLDPKRIQSILAAPHAYYGSGKIPIRKDTRFHPGATTMLIQNMPPGARLLDVGCGNGGILLELSPYIQEGVGIDNNPDHIRLAEQARRAAGAANLAFLLLDFPGGCGTLAEGSFDVLCSLRGPVGDRPQNLQAALRLLREDGMLFIEEIGERHQPEARSVFGDPADVPSRSPLLGWMENAGAEVRLAAEIFTKWIYPDFYAWFAYQCNIWSWLGKPLPAANDPRLEQFANHFAGKNGEISTTHHVTWLAGIKR